MNQIVPAKAAKAPTQQDVKASPSNYKGFVAGVFSGIAKLSVRRRKPYCKKELLICVGRPPLRHNQSEATNFNLGAIFWAFRLSAQDSTK